MLSQILGLHHVTLMASDAQTNNAFFTRTLGLRRVKKTVNFDAPDVYHLYYGDAQGTPGTVMTYFPFPHAARGTPGAGEVAMTAFAVPVGSLSAWRQRLTQAGTLGIIAETRFGENRLQFSGPDGETLALVEVARDPRNPWTGGGLAADLAIRGFHSVTIRLHDAAATSELLQVMGYRVTATEGSLTRLRLPDGNGADTVDIEALPGAAPARQGAGSVHHVAFAVENRARQLEVRQALTEAGVAVTPVIDRDYFWAIYFRTPGGVLFEIATNEPGFARDEDPEHLGQALKLPLRHEHLRSRLELDLKPISDLADGA